MTRIYSQKDYEQAVALKRKLINQVIILSAVCLVLNAVVILLKFGVPWGQSTFWYLFANCVISIAYAVWLIYFIGVPFKLINQYCKFYKSAVNCSENPERGIFLGMREDLEYRDGIDYYEMLFYPGQDIKGKERVLKVFFEADKPVPELEIGDEVDVLVSSSVLVGYDVVNAGALNEDELNGLMAKLSKKLGIITEEDIEE